MAILKEPFFPVGAHEPAGVFCSGKSSEQAKGDLQAGIARLGGSRSPNYCQAYLWSAGELLTNATVAGHLDHHAMPIFHLQRHAAELLLKAPIELGIAVQDQRARFGQPRPCFPSSPEQRVRVAKSHDLQALLDDLVEMVAVMQVGVVPRVLCELIELILRLEDHPTWSRYEYRLEGRKEPRRLVRHIANEIVIPLAEIQRLLKTSNDNLGSLWPSGTGLVMGRLAEMLEVSLRSAGEIA
ncbi:hypothetical protein [Delftia acidovorans]|uniref:hypothetical protein n=1 Tax=Delftia acidovorans TaxID=80866 RepID=UPI00359F3616